MLLINILGYIVDVFLCHITLLFTAEIMPTVYTHSQTSEWLSWKFSSQSAVRLVTGRIYCPQYGFWFSTGGQREVRGHLWCWAGECIESFSACMRPKYWVHALQHDSIWGQTLHPATLWWTVNASVWPSLEGFSTRNETRGCFIWSLPLSLLLHQNTMEINGYASTKIHSHGLLHSTHSFNTRAGRRTASFQYHVTHWLMRACIVVTLFEIAWAHWKVHLWSYNNIFLVEVL